MTNKEIMKLAQENLKRKSRKQLDRQAKIFNREIDLVAEYEYTQEQKVKRNYINQLSKF